MSRSYASRYPNEVHQFNIGVSKRQSIDADGRVNYHRTSLRPELSDILDPRHRYLFFYLVRDHFSGLFFTEIFPAGTHPWPIDFLMKAWTRKEEIRFCGMPDYLVIPDTVEKIFPGTRSRAESLKISTLKPTSGFQGGVRDLRTVEKSMLIGSGTPIEELHYFMRFSLKFQEKNPSHIKGIKKGDLWDANVTHLRFPEAY